MTGGGTLRAVALALAAMAVLATHDAAVKLLGSRYAPFQLLFFVALFSAPLVTLALVHDRRAPSLRPAAPGWVGLRSVCIVLATLTAIHAFTALPLAQTYALLFTMPLWVTALAVPMLGERVRPVRALATLAGLGGVLLVLQPGQATLGLGHAAALASAFLSALAGVIARRLGRSERTITLLFWPVAGNLLLGAAALPVVYRPMALGDLGLMAAIAALNLLGNALIVAAYRAGEAALVAPMQYSQMLWAVGYGWLLFHERPDPAILPGIAVIVGAGLVALRATPEAPVRPSVWPAPQVRQD